MFFKKNFLGVFSIVNFALVAIILSYAAINFYSEPATKDSEAKKEFAFQSCSALARSIGIKPKVNQSRGYIEFEMNDISNWEKQIAQSSIIINGCKGFELSTYCQSNECKPSPTVTFSGTIMKIKYKEKIK